MRIVGLDDGSSNEDPYEEVIKVAGYSGLSLKRDSISVCRQLLSRNGRDQPLNAHFVRREEKIEMMRNKKNLKSQLARICLKHDVTPVRSRILFSLRRDLIIIYEQSVNEKILVFNAKNSKMVLNTLYDVRRAFPKNVQSALNQKNNPFQKGILLLLHKILIVLVAVEILL